MHGVDFVVAVAHFDGGGRVAAGIGVERALDLAQHQSRHVLDAVVEGGLQAHAFELERAAGQLLGHVADALEIGGDVDGGDDGAQVRSHGLAARDHRNGHVVDAALHVVDALVGDDGEVRQLAIKLEQGLGAVFDRDLDLTAHLGDQLGEGGQFVGVGL